MIDANEACPVALGCQLARGRQVAELLQHFDVLLEAMPEFGTHGMNGFRQSLFFLSQFQGLRMVLLTRRTGRAGRTGKFVLERFGQDRVVGAVLIDANRETSQTSGKLFQRFDGVIQALGRAPGKPASLRDLDDFVDHRGHRACGIFYDASAASHDGQHGSPLSTAPILPQDDGVILGKFDCATRRQKRQLRRDFGRVVLGFPAMVRAAFLGQTEGLPLRNPIGAFPLAIGIQLRFHVIQLRFIHVGALVQLELRETLFQNGLDVVDGMSFQKIQDHGIGHDKLTVDRLRVVREPVCDGAEVDVRRWRDYDEPHVIFPSSSTAAGELLDFIDGQFHDIAILAHTRLGNHHGAGGEVHTGGQGGGGKNGIQAPLTHEFFDGDFPGR